SRRRHTRCYRDWSSDVCSSDLAYLKRFGATKVEEEAGRPVPYEETGTVATQIPGVGVTSHSSNGGYHTFEMEADALGEVGHHGRSEERRVGKEGRTRGGRAD